MQRLHVDGWSRLGRRRLPEHARGAVKQLRRIALADRFARATGRPLAVLALGTPPTARAIAARASGLAVSAPAAVHSWPDWDAREIADPIMRIAPSMIVGDFAGLPFADREAAIRVFRRLPAPLLLLSPEAGDG